MCKQLWKDFWDNPWQPRYLLPLIIINSVGSLYGYYWYHNQLMENPWYLWILISDSPLSTTFLALALILALLNCPSPLLIAIGAATTIKYGLWALVILTHYWLAFHEVRPVEVGLWLGHLGMALEGLVFLQRAKLGLTAAIGAITWMLVNDWVDYAYQLHPYLFFPEQERLAMISAVLITLGVVILIINRLPGRQGGPAER